LALKMLASNQFLINRYDAVYVA